MLITTQKELDTRIKALEDCDFITVDTEFLREKTYFSKLCLVQISGPDKDAFAIDPLGGEGDLDLSGLFDLLLNPKILKVFHAARGDLEIFFNLMEALPTPVFDTQIAAMVCGYGESIGYDNLVRNITGQSLDKSSQYTNWSHRPLSQKQLDYALGDVTHLVDVYEHLSKKLDEQGRREWAAEEEAMVNDPKTYDPDPMDAWQRIKIRSPKPQTLAVLQALAAWREKEAQRRNIPRGWVLRDETLADIAGQSPKNTNGLKKIRNIPGDLSRNNLGNTLIGLIKKAIESPADTWPAPKKKKPLPSSAAATVDILKMLLKVQSAEHNVAIKLLASSDELEAFASNQSKDIRFLKGWRYDVFGREAQALKEGTLAIGLKDAKITKFKLTSQSETA